MKQFKVSGLKAIFARMGTVVDGTFDKNFERGVEATFITGASQIMPLTFLESQYYTGFDGLVIGVCFSIIPCMVGAMMVEDDKKGFAALQVMIGGLPLGLLTFKALSLGLIGSVDYWSVPCAVVVLGAIGLAGAAVMALAESIENK